MTITVIIVTLNRPDCVKRCLNCLNSQIPVSDQIIVVDASPDNRTRTVVEAHPQVVYLRNDNGYGRMTASRNIGLTRATGDIIAFLDDDAFAYPNWLSNLLATYTDPTIGAVGGRALNNQPNEATNGVHEIGQLKPDGTLTGNFAADPGKIIEVDHVMGCNMSFRRVLIAQLGGFREDYPGISGVREDSDMCLRVKRLGYKIHFNPLAVVDHIGAPQAVGKRFDTRYAYYAARNHMVLLLRNFGPQSKIFWKYLLFLLFDSTKEFCRRLASAFVRLFAVAAGTFVGLFSGLRILLTLGRDPIRHTPAPQPPPPTAPTQTEPLSPHP